MRTARRLAQQKASINELEAELERARKVVSAAAASRGDEADKSLTHRRSAAGKPKDRD